MKIAVNTRFLLKDKLEGIGRVTYELLTRMVANHPNDEFIFLFDRPFDPSFVFADNVKAIHIFPPARHSYLWYWWFEMSVPRILKKENPDVFFSPDGYCSLTTDIPTVMITHDIAHVHYPDQLPDWALKYYNKYVPQFLNRAEKIISVSKATKKDIVKTYNIEEAKIEVVYNGCGSGFVPIENSIQQSIRKKYADNEDYFFYIGSINPRKNIHRLIEAFDLFKKKSDSKTKLLLGGRFAWKPTIIQNAFDNAAYKDDIIFLDYVETAELPKILGSAKALVYVSMLEGFGIPIVEAMHSEVPVITSNVSSMPEIAGQAALLVDPLDVNYISNALIEMDSNEELREELVWKGRVERERFDWELAAEHVYNILQAQNRISNKPS